MLSLKIFVSVFFWPKRKKKISGRFQATFWELTRVHGSGGQVSQEWMRLESKYGHWLLERAEEKQGPAYKVLCKIPRHGQPALRRSCNIMYIHSRYWGGGVIFSWGAVYCSLLKSFVVSPTGFVLIWLSESLQGFYDPNYCRLCWCLFVYCCSVELIPNSGTVSLADRSLSHFCIASFSRLGFYSIW